MKYFFMWDLKEFIDLIVLMGVGRFSHISGPLQRKLLDMIFDFLVCIWGSWTCRVLWVSTDSFSVKHRIRDRGSCLLLCRYMNFPSSILYISFKVGILRFLYCGKAVVLYLALLMHRTALFCLIEMGFRRVKHINSTW